MSILHALAHAQHYKILLWLNFFFFGVFFLRDFSSIGKNLENGRWKERLEMSNLSLQNK